MKNIGNILSLAVAVVLMITGCQMDEPELDSIIESTELNFSVTQNPDDPNMVILESLTPNVIPMWVTPVGRSTKVKDTVRLPFSGTYDFVYNVSSGGGFMNGDTTTLDITTMNLSYVDDPLWNLLTGGVGETKTWIMDNGAYGLATGPCSFADPALNQVWGDYTSNWDPPGDDPNIEATEATYNAEMTFSLDGGAFLTTIKPNEGGITESGTFFLDAEARTLSSTDATILRVETLIANADNWTTNLNILELTNDQLRVAVFRTNEEGPWWYILNYVSKEYAENYEPGFTPDPNFDHGDQMLILAGNSSSEWKLSSETPFNWVNLEGGFLNEWFESTDYPDWTGFNADAVENFDGARISFSRTGEVVLTADDASEMYGTFSIDEKTNLVTFSEVRPSIYIGGGWVYASTTEYVEDDAENVISEDNQWKIIRTGTTSGVVTDVWFGKRDPEKAEYMVFHFELVSGAPDVEREMIRGLTGGISGETSSTFKIDLDHPVDWTDPLGVGWTEPGSQADWYWSEAVAASVANQRITFSQVDGVITATKIDEDGVSTSSSVEIDADTRSIILSDIDIIQFGAGSELPTTGPEYRWVRGEFNAVADEGLWIGLKTGDTEYIAYHYILD